MIPIQEWFPISNDESQTIHKPVGPGNPMMARGAFGEIAMAIWAPPPTDNSSSNGNGNASNVASSADPSWKLVAVKTIMSPMANNSNDRDNQDDDTSRILQAWAATTTTTPSSSSASAMELEVPKVDMKLAPPVLHEICALRRLNPHPNIVTLRSVYSSSASNNMMHGSTVCLAFEYRPVDLYTALEWRRRTIMPPLSMSNIAGIALDLVTALQHCHSNGVLHLDIKPGNLLITSGGTLQLCDFGLARPMGMLDEDDEVTGMCTLYYRPPELLLGASANAPSIDMYSAGLVIAEVVAGFPIFRGGNVLGQLAAIFKVLGTPNENNWPGVREMPDYGKLQFATQLPQPLETLLPRAKEESSFNLLNLLEHLVVLDPSQRYSAAQALQQLSMASERMDRRALQRDLIPSSLSPPILLSNPTRDLTLAHKIAMETALMKRTFLSKLQPEWKDSSAVSPSSVSALEKHCASLLCQS